MSDWMPWIVLIGMAIKVSLVILLGVVMTRNGGSDE